MSPAPTDTASSLPSSALAPMVVAAGAPTVRQSLRRSGPTITGRQGLDGVPS